MFINFLRRVKQRSLHSLLTSYKKPESQIGELNQSNRDEWLEGVLSSIEAGKTILDAGAGVLKYKKLCKHLNYVSQDFGQYDGKGDEIGFQEGDWDQSRIDIVSDITAIPRPAASFDAVMCIEVLEHVPNPIEAVRELVRLLKPGGVFILTAPFCSLTHFSPYFYHTGFSQNFYKHWLENFGCEIEDLVFNGNYFEYMGQELRRLSHIGGKYSGISISLVEKDAIEVVLGLLARFSEKDTDSHEVLSYGIQVRARKLEQ